MIDDLNDLLGNIDEGSDSFKIIRDAENQQKEKTARRSDRNIGNSSEIKTGYIDIMNRYKKSNEIQFFAKGYVEFLSQHWEYCQKLRVLLNDLAIPAPVADILKKNKYALLKILQNIEQNYNEFIAKQNMTALLKKAKNDFPLVFAVEEQTQARINFLALKELFLRLRELNSRIKKEWTDMNSAFGLFNITKEGLNYAQEFSQYSSGGLDLCLSTEEFVKYLAVVVGIPEDNYDVLEKEINNKIFFREAMSYSWESIFEIFDKPAAASAIADDSFLDIERRTPEPKIQHADAVQGKGLILNEEPQPAPSVSIKRNLDISAFFSVRGTSSWNTREPYVININADAYEKNLSDLNHSILFVRKKEDHLQLAGAIKRAMINFIREKNDNIVRGYEEFVFKFISMTASHLSETFGASDNIQLFLYHCGPLTTYRIVKYFFEKDSIGICFRYLGENKISKFYPDELIKVAVLKWHEVNVNSFDLPFDRIQEFNEIKRKVSEKYEIEKNTNLKKVSIAVSQHYLKTGKRIKESDLLAAKAKELFGICAIPVYQRFIDKTIFR